MRAMVMTGPGQGLQLQDIPIPVPDASEILIRVVACGICRTDLHILDGELSDANFPLVPGHQIVGTVERMGNDVTGFELNQRVGVPWLGGSCGHCSYCDTGVENLCDEAVYTGYQVNGGLAEYTVADSRYCFTLPQGYSDTNVAPLLCAGLIGYRAYRMVGNAKRIGLYGFGAAAHILIQIARYQQVECYAFTRTGDESSQQFARQLGATWAGDSEASPPATLDAAIIFAPAGELVPRALQAVRKGGRVICAGIHMSDIPSFAYELLWGERSIHSVANLTREDAREFLPLAARVPVETQVNIYPLDAANQALDDLRHGRFEGAAVIQV